MLPDRRRGLRWAPPYARRAAALAALLLSAACGGPQAPTTTRHVMASERLMACGTFVQELRTMNLSTEPETMLVDRLEAARASTEVCAELWLEAADTPGERVIAAQDGRQIPLQALLIEGALSVRFDAMSGYCDILDETFVLLFSGFREIELALTDGTPLTDDERARLVELRDLDLEGLDVLALHREENCR